LLGSVRSGRIRVELLVGSSHRRRHFGPSQVRRNQSGVGLARLGILIGRTQVHRLRLLGGGRQV